MPPRPEHDTDNYAGWTETQLVQQVMSNAGAAGAGAHGELLRRSMLAADKQANRLATLTIVIIVLTAVIAVLTIVLVVVDLR